MFCIGASDNSTIRTADIDAMIRQKFPNTVSADQLGVDQILAGLADGTNPILLKNPNEATYRLTHPKLRLAIRTRLESFGVEKGEMDKLLADLLSALKIDL